MRAIITWALCLFFCAAAQAQVTVNGTPINAGPFVVTGGGAVAWPYAVRGLDASQGNPALQGNITITHPDSGFYAKVWASQVDLGGGDPTHAEIDYVIGASGIDDDKWIWGLSVAWYDFPGAPARLEYDFAEIIMELRYRFEHVTIGGEAAISPDFFGEGGIGMYIRGLIDVPLSNEWTLNAHAGHQGVTDGPSYDDWAVGATYQPKGKNWSAYVGYMDAKDCPTCDGRIFGKVSFVF